MPAEVDLNAFGQDVASWSASSDARPASSSSSSAHSS